MNSLQNAIGCLGEAARPFVIVFLGVCIGVSLFVHVDSTALTIVAGLEGVFIGARSFENNAQIKANVATSTATASVATPDKVTTVTQGVQPEKPK